ncbi:DUF4202 domain-containing protein [Spongiivirga citrea]|uniref:DUF4202 family protein n=1 Tax=Spongiivirga citrea TaxID=1481457 RepID=A0A6M0CK45_9FLAO|nr:DUF4202 domain-containing protein [Spongiivirga citrea]NER16299.1 DUF4202 family protein [Spongiivirga citrea]
MPNQDKLQHAFQLFDAANQQDPNTEVFEGKSYPKELLYAHRMTRQLNRFFPDASEALQLTARCQHICRWEIARNSFPMNREGYLRWRQELKKFHAEKAATILREVGYSEEMIEKVQFLLLKKQLRKNEETQVLEDVICLVFLEYYFEAFAMKYPKEKTIDILQKTWCKMSEKGQKAALELPLSEYALSFVSEAINA